ncbi:peroxisomal carnitine O-octanoyltransferase isoform X3 [Lagenorhynchus albirostris]|uniref:peroxisomal carnitine O-octanoyltransferase isoform X3 n=1 Tax=Lagenorhynchus albirostris TaxID=27610 RepID=UPI0028EC6524|nr:peroxisomal carnitine O-octanoyltransferase isoform X3 [Lagenorhynchus albirostris]
MENQLAKSGEERTFQYQDSLPSLPVPSLEESLKKYLESVKPFANEEEYKKTEAIVQKFQNGIGEKLQQKLLERAKEKRNWLEDWWLNVAYLDVRIPSQLHVNFGGPASHIEHYWPPKEGTQLERGSISLWHILNYWQLLRKEKLPVHKVGNTPLDMNQFRMLFSTCKVPGITRDSVINYFRTESEGHCPSHIAVMCRGRVFVFDVMHEGCLMTPPEILSPGCCYETAMTRYFYHGRTETVRSCTVEAVRWCQSMQDPSTSLFEQQHRMLEAFAKHNKMMKDCSTGKGFDRHLLGLSLIAKEECLPVPELFTDPLFSRSGGGGNFVLSTSLIGYLRVQGVVVPMVHNGYGFFYHIRDDRFIVACTAWKSCPETDAEKLVQQTFRAFSDMMQLMDIAHL